MEKNKDIEIPISSQTRKLIDEAKKHPNESDSETIKRRLNEVKQDASHWKNMRNYIRTNRNNGCLVKIIPEKKDIAFRDFWIDFELNGKDELVGVDCCEYLFLPKEKFWVSLKDFMEIDFNELPVDMGTMKDYVMKKFRSKY